MFLKTDEPTSEMDLKKYLEKYKWALLHKKKLVN
jgi:hypothetical protein